MLTEHTFTELLMEVDRKDSKLVVLRTMGWSMRVKRKSGDLGRQGRPSQEDA